MLAYIYSARTENGQLVTGEIQASDSQAVANILIAKNLFPVKIEPKKGKNLFEFNFFDGVSIKAKAMLVRQFSTLISAGLPIAQALQVLIKQIDKPNLQKIFVNILKDIENGSSLSQAFSKYPKVFSSTEISLIQSGEASGTLETVLKRVARQLEKDQALKSKVKSAMIYPSFVLVVVVGVVAVMLMYVMPKMADLYADLKGDLPLITKIMLNLSNIMLKYWWVVLTGTVASIVISRSFISTPVGRYFWDQTKLAIPGIGKLVEKIILARFTRTLGTLMGSGVPVIESINISAKSCGNVIFYSALKKAAEEVKGGKPLSAPLKSNPHFPPIVGQMVEVGEQTGEMDQMLENLANYYEDEVDTLIKGLSTLLEPIIIVVLGVVVGGILVAIMLPIYGLSQVMFNKR